MNRRGIAFLLSVALPAALWPATPVHPRNFRFGPGSGAAGTYLYIPPQRLAELQAKVAANAPEWVFLKDTVDSRMGTLDDTRNSAMNSALVYLLTGDARYAAAAFNKAEWDVNNTWDFAAGHMRDTFYYEIGDRVRPAAMTLNYCRPALTQAQADFLAQYIDNLLDETWLHQRAFSPPGNAGLWAKDDPGNNFYHNYMDALITGGHVLRLYGHPRGQYWLDIGHGLVQPALDFFRDRVPSGDFYEGVNYGQRSRERLGVALSAVASMEGVNYFAAAPFFSEALRYINYQPQPGKQIIYVAGDMARGGRERIGASDRNWIQTFVYYLPDGEARRRGQWLLSHVVPSYIGADYGGPFNAWDHLWKDMVFGLSLAEQSQADLPLSYVAGGTHWAMFRSGWDAGATSLTISGYPTIHQSHQDADVGSFQFWKRDWQVVDVSAVELNGKMPSAHSMLVTDQANVVYVGDTVAGLTRSAEGGAYAYAQVDATGIHEYDAGSPSHLHTKLMNEWTREFLYLRPDTLFLYDRADAKPGTTYHNRFHVLGPPAQAGSRWSASFGGGSMSFLPLVGGPVTAAADTEPEFGTRGAAWRLEQASTGLVSRFLNILQVADGSVAPALAAQRVVSDTTQMEGALWNDQVVLFSSRPLGQAAALPFSYTVPGTGTMTHTLVNMAGTCDVAVSRGGGNMTVTVSAGSGFTATAEGVVRFTN